MMGLREVAAECTLLRWVCALDTTEAGDTAAAAACALSGVSTSAGPSPGLARRVCPCVEATAAAMALRSEASMACGPPPDTCSSCSSRCSSSACTASPETGGDTEGAAAAAVELLRALVLELPAAESWLAMLAGDAGADAAAGGSVDGRVRTQSAREAQRTTGACEHSTVV